MANIILKSLRVKHFGPFADEVRFTTTTEKSKKEFLENTFPSGDDVFNRISYIFGANGSGKSKISKNIRKQKIHIKKKVEKTNKQKTKKKYINI